MSLPDAGAASRFTLICLKCDRPISARPDWVGREVRCPHCAAVMCVPPPRADGQPVRGALPPLATQEQRFSFACPRCASLLESHPAQCGQTGRCPTCGARFVVPRTVSHYGPPQQATLLDRDDQDPTPMHAYAASGHQAPKIHRRPDGTPEIECPRCGHRCDIAANNCSSCGIPFTIEGVPTARGGSGHTLATAALVLGIVSIPLCALFVPAGLAVVFGVISWFRQSLRRPSGAALAGIILGTVSLGLGALLVFL
jgi:DNA-directed RNA polymerase subunit RPC12/RpoP